MKNIWLIRHGQHKGQIDSNACKINPALSELGIKQAKLLKERILNIETDLVLLSPLERATQTYALSEYHSKKVKFEKRLLEDKWDTPNIYNSSEYEMPSHIAEIDNSDNNTMEFKDRIQSLIEVITQSEHESIMLFCHLGVIIEFSIQFFGNNHLNYSNFEIGNTSVSHFKIDGKGNKKLCLWNDSHHLMQN
jgi:broad specificity phosphatase PhoE